MAPAITSRGLRVMPRGRGSSRRPRERDSLRRVSGICGSDSNAGIPMLRRRSFADATDLTRPVISDQAERVEEPAVAFLPGSELLQQPRNRAANAINELLSQMDQLLTGILLCLSRPRIHHAEAAVLARHDFEIVSIAVALWIRDELFRAVVRGVRVLCRVQHPQVL